MTGLVLEDLWRDVVGSPADSVSHLCIEVELGGESEVPQLHLHAVAEEKISQLETSLAESALLSMDDPVAVEVLQGLDNLVDVALHLDLHQSSTSLDEVVETLVVAELQQDVHIF